VRDEVDELLSAWARELPDLDLAPLAVLSRVSRLARHLDRARRTALAQHDLETFEFDVLTALRRAGPPYELSPGRLLRETLVGSGTMTNRLDRLEGRGLVRRRPDPRDGRGIRVRLTARGRARADRAVADLVARENDLLAGLDGPDRERLAGLLRELLLRFESTDPDRPTNDG
jgi:DNA-binding MarR family transcriptional regulator